MKIEDCVKDITVNKETGEIEIEFKDEQTPEMVKCIREYISSLSTSQDSEDEYEDDDE